VVFASSIGIKTRQLFVRLVSSQLSNAKISWERTFWIQRLSKDNHLFHLRKMMGTRQVSLIFK